MTSAKDVCVGVKTIMTKVGTVVWFPWKLILIIILTFAKDF